MKHFVIAATVAALCIISDSKSLNLYQWILSPLENLLSISERIENEVNSMLIENQNFGRKIERVKRASTGQESSWKSNFKKFRQKQQRKISKANFYKNWKPIPFVPIIRAIPTEATTLASVPLTHPPAGNTHQKTGGDPPKDVPKPENPGTNSTKPAEPTTKKSIATSTPSSKSP